MMTQEKKIRSLFIVIAFLFVTNVVLLLFLIFGKNDDRNSQHTDKRSVIETFLQDKIKFDEKQMALYKNIRNADFEKRVPIFDTLKSAKSRFYENIYNDSIPDSVINKLAEVVSEKQMVVDKHMFEYFKSIRRICTADQLPLFDSSFRDVVEKITAVKFKSKKRDHK
jgi:protein CpxP